MAKLTSKNASVKVPVESIVSFHQKKGTYLFDFSKEIKEGGVFIATKNLEKAGRLIDIIFTKDGKDLLIKGEVLWIQDPIAGREDVTPGMGIQFIDASAKDKQTLQELIIPTTL